MSRDTRIAIIGTGIAGNLAAYKLRERFDITVFEAAAYVGGHTNTIDVEEGEERTPIAIDTGFIVYNDRTYPCFIKLLDELGQQTQASEMSFSVHSADGGIEYNGSNLNGLFAQRSNLLRPTFIRMVRDILRFNRDAFQDLSTAPVPLTLGEYLRDKRYGNHFRDHYLVPMIAAIWSAEPMAVLDMPAEFLVRFFQNHGLLQLDDRPQWHVIKGGSREYVKRLVEGHQDRIRLSCPVQSVSRTAGGVEVATAEGGVELFDYVFMACHSDQALQLLYDATTTERAVLGAIKYQPNEAVLHTDIRVLPKRRRAWAAWNYFVPDGDASHVAVSYNMNILQGLESARTYCVTLNDDSRIAEDKVVRRIQYQHPMFTRESVLAQRRQRDINCDRTFYCGAYWRNGFHEDGVVSALNAIGHFEERLEHAELHLRRAG
ncbi:MAG: FAD-dependent oxidoreductase [Gammaproteobacteria bacterium]|nr:FAD-dependent oxidoreductase [Gammaproteobacteria bacterium]